MYIAIVSEDKYLEEEVNATVNHLISRGEEIVDIRYMKENTFYIIYR